MASKLQYSSVMYIRSYIRNAAKLYNSKLCGVIEIPSNCSIDLNKFHTRLNVIHLIHLVLSKDFYLPVCPLANSMHNYIIENLNNRSPRFFWAQSDTPVFIGLDQWHLS